MCPCQSSGPQSGAKRGNLRTITSRKIGTRLDPELWLLLPRFSLEGVDSVKSGTHRRPSEGDGAAGRQRITASSLSGPASASGTRPLPLKGHSATHSLARCGGRGQGPRISLCPRQPSKYSRAGLTFK